MAAISAQWLDELDKRDRHRHVQPRDSYSHVGDPRVEVDKLDAFFDQSSITGIIHQTFDKRIVQFVLHRFNDGLHAVRKRERDRYTHAGKHRRLIPRFQLIDLQAVCLVPLFGEPIEFVLLGKVSNGRDPGLVSGIDPYQMPAKKFDSTSPIQFRRGI